MNGVPWALYLSPILLIVATIFWISYYFTSVKEGDSMQWFVLFMAAFSAIMAVIRIRGILRRSREVSSQQ